MMHYTRCGRVRSSSAQLGFSTRIRPAVRAEARCGLLDATKYVHKLMSGKLPLQVCSILLQLQRICGAPMRSLFVLILSVASTGSKGQGGRGQGARGKCKFDFTFRIVASLCNCHNVISFRILICVLIRFSHRFRFRFRFRFCAWVCFGFAAVLVFWFAALWFRFRVSHFPFRISIVTHTANFNFPLCLIDLRINYTKY